MKNWIIALAILVIPAVAYFAFDKMQENNSFEAQATTAKPTVLKFHSTMCLDCKKLETVTKEVMPEYAEKVNYKDYNAQKGNAETKALVSKYNITLVPTMIFIKKDGEIYKRTEGFITQEQLRHILNGLIK